MFEQRVKQDRKIRYVMTRRFGLWEVRRYVEREYPIETLDPQTQQIVINQSVIEWMPIQPQVKNTFWRTRDMEEFVAADWPELEEQLAWEKLSGD